MNDNNQAGEEASAATSAHFSPPRDVLYTVDDLRISQARLLRTITDGLEDDIDFEMGIALILRVGEQWCEYVETAAKRSGVELTRVERTA